MIQLYDDSPQQKQNSRADDDKKHRQEFLRDLDFIAEETKRENGKKNI